MSSRPAKRLVPEANGALAFSGDIEDEARENNAFRRVLWTDPSGRSQLAVMAISSEDREAGREVHSDTTQLVTIVEGFGIAVLGADSTERIVPLHTGVLVIVPAGLRHNFINDSHKPLKLYTVYTSAHHAPGAIHLRRVDAMKYEARVSE
jgi:mannose-6-phosphate isomerase-like protein (cupin superfamily)